MRHIGKSDLLEQFYCSGKIPPPNRLKFAIEKPAASIILPPYLLLT